MRYQNWDVLLFPERSKVPVQEFKTACHVVQDTGPEFVHLHQNMLLLPTVTSFVPGLPAGQPFRLSIHSWENPEPSRFAQNFSKHPDLIMFEARVFIDGRLAGSKFFGRGCIWPTIVDESLVEYNKNGDPASLRFPSFHQELLTQSYWNAGDELGRIKVVIAEGFIRDSASVPFERIKNIVAFSFQHAPLDVLESSCIAWPNTTMWRQVSFATPYPLPQVSPRKIIDNGPELHSHSPRRRNSSLARSTTLTSRMGPMLPPGMPVFPRTTTFDPFTDLELTHQRQPSDTTMPDYSSTNSHVSQSRKVTDTIMAEKSERQCENMQNAGAFVSVLAALKPSEIVSDSPGSESGCQTMNFALQSFSSDSMCSDLSPEVLSNDNNLAKVEGNMSMLIAPSVSDGAGSVRSRKENMHESPTTRENGPGGSDGMRKVAQPVFTAASLSNKRPRFVTPVALKVIDQEDEPRSSPILRKVSQGLTTTENRDGERRVLSGIEPNII